MSEISKYQCYGVRYLEAGISQEDLDSCFEVFEKHFGKKIYSATEMKLISDRFGFDINDYYAFVGMTPVTRIDPKVKIRSLYRYFGSKKVSEDFLEKEFTDKINPDLFYSRVDIENLSQEIGCSVFDRNDFRPYTIVEYSFPGIDLNFTCVRK